MLGLLSQNRLCGVGYLIAPTSPYSEQNAAVRARRRLRLHEQPNFTTGQRTKLHSVRSSVSGSEVRSYALFRPALGGADAGGEKIYGNHGPGIP